MGEAWLLEGWMWNWMPDILSNVFCISEIQCQHVFYGNWEFGRGRERKGNFTCHFRHVGLKLGAPALAASSSAKTKRTGTSSGAIAQRAGRPFSGYVRRGKRLKRRRMGSGTAKMLV